MTQPVVIPGSLNNPRARILSDVEIRFKNPGPTSRTVPFWFLGHPQLMSAEEIDRQMGEFHKQRMDVICLIPYGEMYEVYLQESWWQTMGWIIDAAKKYGMSIWIGDDCGCPSGSAAMTISQIPEFRSVGMQYFHRIISSKSFDLTDLYGDLIAVYKVMRSEAGAQHDLSTELIQIDPAHWREYIDSKTSTEFIFITTGAMKGHDSPNRMAQGFGRGEVNRLEAEAMRLFVENTHEEYARFFGEELGKTICGVFTDEPAIFDPPSLSGDFWVEFECRKGYDLRPFLPALWTDLGPATPRYRVDYHQVVSDLYRERFFEPQRQWCARKNIPYTGHIWQMWPFSLNGGAFWQPDPLRILAELDVPGVDWTAGVGKIPVSEIKFASSATQLAGRLRTLVEVFAGVGYAANLEQFKWMVNWIFVNGVDLLVSCMHFYSIDGPNIIVPHSSFFWQAPQWPYQHLFTEYTGRISEMLQAGKQAASVAVLYPTASIWAETIYPEGCWAKPPDAIPPFTQAVESIRTSVSNISNYLIEHQVDFNFIDEIALAESTLNEGAIHIGDASYRTIVLPHMTTCSHRTLDVLNNFLIASGRLVSVGALPEQSTENGQADPDVLRLVAALKANGLQQFSANFSGLVDHLLGRDLRIIGGNGRGPELNLYYQHRSLEDGDLYFLVNHSAQPQEYRVWFVSEGCVELWDPEDGKQYQVTPGEPAGSGTRLDLNFEPYQAFSIVFSKQNRYWLPVSLQSLVFSSPLDGYWTIEFLSNATNRFLAPYDREYDFKVRPLGSSSTLVPWWQLGMDSFSGSARYHCEFNLNDVENEQRVWIDLGRVEQTAEVWLNGRPLGARIWHPYRFEVTGLLKHDLNTLDICVTNSLANFLSYGHAGNPPVINQLPVQARVSGLLGPIQFMQEPITATR